MKLCLGYFYPEELNLYGDTGNVEILLSRASQRGFETELIEIDSSTELTNSLIKKINLIFMGGGPDAGQKQMYEDLISNKGPRLKEYVNEEGVALFICGSYQLLGSYYKAADGSKLDGLGILDLYTEHPGIDKQRCVGNIICKLSSELTEDKLFKSVNKIGGTIVGFENHGGRTYLNTENENIKPFAHTKVGYGNNLRDKTEGVIYKKSIGTYLHGPLLSKNPHIADYLIASALGLENLDELDDTTINKAHSALIKRFN